MTSPDSSIRDQTNARIYAASDFDAAALAAGPVPTPVPMTDPIADVTKGPE